MAVDLFLKLTKNGAPIKGESQDKTFPDLIQLDSFEMSALSLLSLSESNPDAAGDDACSFTVKKLLDLSSTDLFRNYIDAQSPEKRASCLLQCTVYFRHDGPVSASATPESASFLAMDFLDAFVYDYSLSADGESRRPAEEVKFYFDKYRMTYRAAQMTPSGLTLGAPQECGWDFAAEKPGPLSSR